jgi:hypothetical protein
MKKKGNLKCVILCMDDLLICQEWETSEIDSLQGQGLLGGMFSAELSIILLVLVQSD